MKIGNPKNQADKDLLVMPDGGQDGQTLVKSGNNVVWGEANITVDSAMSDTSTNPVQNKVVKAAIDAKTIAVDSALSDTSVNPVQNKVVKAALDLKLNADVVGDKISENITIVDNKWVVGGVDTGVSAVGPANTLAIGNVTSGTTANASIVGEAPNQTLNLTLPKGAKGDKGDEGVLNIVLSSTEPSNPVEGMIWIQE
jgi:hypothetical protein